MFLRPPDRLVTFSDFDKDRRRGASGCRFRGALARYRSKGTKVLLFQCLCQDCISLRVKMKDDPDMAKAVMESDGAVLSHGGRRVTLMRRTGFQQRMAQGEVT